MKIEQVQARAKDLIDADKARDSLFTKIDNAIHHVWDLPAGLPDRDATTKFVSTDASDAVNKARQSMMGNRVQFVIPALTQHEADKERVNTWEKALRWLFWLADKRQSGNVLNTLITNAVQYGMVAGKVVYLPHELKAREAFGASEKEARRLRQAMRFGPFAYELYNPRDVHAIYSDWMLEAILVKRVMTQDAIVAFWGKKASSVLKAVGDDETLQYATLYDYNADGKRWVWAELTEHAQLVPPNSGNSAVIMDGEDTELDFMPYFARVLGTATPGNGDTGVEPLLRSVIESRSWEDANLIKTLLFNNPMRKVYRPQIIQNGGIPLEVDYTNPAMPVAYTPQAGSIQANPEQPFDPGLQQLWVMTQNSINKSTVPEQFQTGDVPSGTGVGTVQLLTQNVLSGFTPYRRLVEAAVADIGLNSMYWVKHEGTTLSVDGIPGVGGVEIDPSLYDADYLYVEAKLVPDVPIEVSAANATLLAKQAGVDEETALEAMNIQNPGEVITKRRKQQLDEVAFGNLVALEQAKVQLQIQEAQMQMQAGIQQQVEQQAQSQAMNANNQQVQAEAQQMQMMAGRQNPAMGANSPVNEGAMMREEAQAAGLA